MFIHTKVYLSFISIGVQLVKLNKKKFIGMRDLTRLDTLSAQFHSVKGGSSSLFKRPHILVKKKFKIRTRVRCSVRSIIL